MNRNRNVLKLHCRFLYVGVFICKNKYIYVKLIVKMYIQMLVLTNLYLKWVYMHMQHIYADMYIGSTSIILSFGDNDTASLEIILNSVFHF